MPNNLLTDPSNHPANGPLPVPRIERVIEALESSLKYRNGSSMDTVLADAVKGLRELRESREQQPVARRMRYKDGPWLYKQIGDDGQAEGCYTEQVLYREPVAAPCTIPTQSSNDVNDAAWKLHDMLTEHGPLNGYQFNNLKECFYEALKVAMRNSPATPDGWKEEAEKLAEAYGAAFVIFRHGEEPVCADPTKFWFDFDPAAPQEVK